MKRTLLTLAATAIGLTASHAATIFQLNDNLSLSHTSANTTTAPPLAGSAALNTGTFTWGNLATDGDGGNAEFSGSSFSSSDWGGLGTYISNAVSVENFDAATITFAGTSNFNTGSEFFEAFYQLDGGSEIGIAAGVEDVEGPFGAIVPIDVSGADTLTLGFRYNHNGAPDFATISEFSVDAVPEPSSTALIGLAGLGLVLRRRK